MTPSYGWLRRSARCARSWDRHDALGGPDLPSSAAVPGRRADRRGGPDVHLVGRAVEFSRNRAIENSALLVADIERYRDANGHYPPSLLALHHDYKPVVVGIEKYHYEPNGEGYNVFFEQLSDRLGVREIVMYNIRDEHVMTSHAMDLLTLTPAELVRQRGYNAVHNASRAHWKYFWFD